MFDDLHDPDPPIADMATLNQVAKRAGRLRRRRALIIGTGAGALAVAVTIATLAIVNSDDAEGRLVVDVSPTASPVITTDVATTTSLVIPGTSVPLAPPTPSTLAPEAVDTAVGPETTVVDTTLAPETTTTLPATTTTVAVATGPIAAINGDGDAVLVDPSGATTLLYDGTDPDSAPPAEGETAGVDLVAVTADGSQAFIGVCCEPVAGTLFRTAPPTSATNDSPSVFGHAPALSPSGATLARVVYDTVVVSDLSFRDLAAIPENFDLGVTYDLAWVDDQHLLALRVGPAGTDLRVLQFSGNALTEMTTATIFGAAVDPVTSATFAGRGDGVVYLLGVAADALAGYDRSTLVALPDRNIALAGAISAWVDNSVVRWVDGVRQLHIGDVVVPGEFLWVR